jgi:4-amino-4-deoxy-L-arabinose transferase-like glycosyltransferase
MHDNGKPWFDKPPLYMWCTAFFYNIFGINEFSVRVTSGLFGIATVLLVYIFTKKMVSRNAGILAALTLLASPHYLLGGRNHYAAQRVGAGTPGRSPHPACRYHQCGAGRGY